MLFESPMTNPSGTFKSHFPSPLMGVERTILEMTMRPAPCHVEDFGRFKLLKLLTEHFKTHVKDHHSRRGLLRMVSRRRKLLDYLKRTNADTYRALIERLDNIVYDLRLEFLLPGDAGNPHHGRGGRNVAVGALGGGLRAAAAASR